jgi:hypothetical protein
MQGVGSTAGVVVNVDASGAFFQTPESERRLAETVGAAVYSDMSFGRRTARSSA